MTTAPMPQTAGTGLKAVLSNRPFTLLWLAQLTTQIGGNIMLYGLTVIVSDNYSNTAVSALILTFLVPAVLLSAVAGVYVDRLDRRWILIVTNVLRAIAVAAMFFAGDHLLALLLLNIFVSAVTVFFAPAEAAMIPFLVPRKQLLAANGLFTLTLNAAFALGFALFGPLLVTLSGGLGPSAVVLFVAALYLLAAGLCFTLPRGPAPGVGMGSAGQAVADAEKAVESTVAQLREGLAFIRGHRGITWSLVYLGIAASVVGVLGVLGPDFAREALGLETKDFVVVVLPLGAGIVMGILLLNSYGKYLPRRRVIEGGLVSLGVLLGLLSVAGPISQLLRRAETNVDLVDLSIVTSLLAVVVAIAFVAGIAYGFVAIPAQTQLQEDLPEDVRGRVFGVLNMLVSVSSFLPIIIVGPISDLIGTGMVILIVAILIAAAGVASIIQRGPLRAVESMSTAEAMVPGAALEPIGVMTHADPLPLDWTETEDVDDDVAPWITAAGWGRKDRRGDSQAGGGRPPPPVAADHAAQPAARAAADPFGLAPDDPEAIARAETASYELPWGPDDERGQVRVDDPDADHDDEPAAPRTPPRRD